MPFPRNRFQLAGASPVELDALEAEHDALPAAMQAANERHFDTMDTTGLTDALKVRRAHGIAGVEREVRERDPEDLKVVQALLDGQHKRRRRARAKSK
jgi:hypothetical protein